MWVGVWNLADPEYRIGAPIVSVSADIPNFNMGIWIGPEKNNVPSIIIVILICYFPEEEQYAFLGEIGVFRHAI